MPQTPDTPAASTGFNLVAGLAAAIIPGGGHLVLGEHKRAALVATGILGLFFGGILVGGIDVIDSREDRVWFFGQALVGPVAFGVDYLHQNKIKGIDDAYFDGGPGSRSTHESRLAEGRAALRSANPGEVRRVEQVSVAMLKGGTKLEEVPILSVPAGGGGDRGPNIKSLSKVNELGTLFATIAGMLNVIVVVDALLPGRRKG